MISVCIEAFLYIISQDKILAWKLVWWIKNLGVLGLARSLNIIWHKSGKPNARLGNCTCVGD